MSRKKNLSDKIGKDDTCPRCGGWLNPDDVVYDGLCKRCRQNKDDMTDHGYTFNPLTKKDKIAECQDCDAPKCDWQGLVEDCPMHGKQFKTVPGESLGERRAKERDSESQSDYTHVRIDSGVSRMRHVPGCRWYWGDCDCGAAHINEHIDDLTKETTRLQEENEIFRKGWTLAQDSIAAAQRRLKCMSQIFRGN